MTIFLVSYRKLFAPMCSLAAFLFLSNPANATTFNFNLTGDINNIDIYNGDNGGYGTISHGRLALLNTDTASNSIPGYTLAVGDTINATITLNSSLTIPASSLYTGLEFNLLSSYNGWVQFNQAFTIYNNDEVTSPLIGQYSATGGYIAFGRSTFFQDAINSSISFDKIKLSADITVISPGEHSSDDYQNYGVQSVNLDTNYPYLIYTTLNAAAVPEPEEWAMMLVGLSYIAWKRRKQEKENCVFARV